MVLFYVQKKGEWRWNIAEVMKNKMIIINILLIRNKQNYL
jgi:hypothetical protein